MKTWRSGKNVTADLSPNSKKQAKAAKAKGGGAPPAGMPPEGEKPAIPAVQEEVLEIVRPEPEGETILISLVAVSGVCLLCVIVCVCIYCMKEYRKK